MPLLAFAVLIYAVMSAVTLVAYARDKRAARRGHWRTRERTLHALAALGGFPGAMLGQHLLRHKRRQTRFVALTLLIAVVHLAAWCLAWQLARG